MVLGPERPSRRPGDVELIVGCSGEPDGERLHRPTHAARHQCDYEAGVEPAAEHRAEGDVAHELSGHGVVEQVEQLLAPLLLGPVCDRRRLRIPPIALDAYGRRLDDDSVSREQLLHMPEQGPRSGDESEREVQVHRLEVDLRWDESAREDCLELGAEQQDTADLGVVERLDSKPVPCEKRPAPLRIPDREGEDPVQGLRHCVADAAVQVREDLRVTGRAEPMTCGREVLAEGLLVVQLAVLDGHDRAALVRHRLMASYHVDDAQPAHTHRDTFVEVVAVVVRPAVKHRVGHPSQHVLVERYARGPPKLDRAADPAHSS